VVADTTPVAVVADTILAEAEVVTLQVEVVGATARVAAGTANDSQQSFAANWAAFGPPVLFLRVNRCARNSAFSNILPNSPAWAHITKKE
jgi:hypothetical protein